jgi:hypothetical protein
MSEKSGIVDAIRAALGFRFPCLRFVSRYVLIPILPLQIEDPRHIPKSARELSGFFHPPAI